MYNTNLRLGVHGYTRARGQTASGLQASLASQGNRLFT